MVLSIKRITNLLLFIGILCCSLSLYAQDSTFVKDLSEEKELKFQEYFFNALSEKSIRNYQKAIMNLESCNEISPNEVSVLFEFSKNYLLLNDTNQAKTYIEQALKIEPDNNWMRGHLVAVLMKEYNYKDAIDVQKKIVQSSPKGRSQLARLYYLNRDYENAISLMNQLESEGSLSKNLKSLKNSLEQRKGNKSVTTVSLGLTDLIKQFEGDTSSFKQLENILDLAIDQDQQAFHKYSLVAIELFPAQPKSYLSRGKSLFLKGESEQALLMLESGLDFIVDNQKIEKQFYEQFIAVFLELKNEKKVEEYKSKIAQLKDVE